MKIKKSNKIRLLISVFLILIVALSLFLIFNQFKAKAINAYSSVEFVQNNKDKKWFKDLKDRNFFDVRIKKAGGGNIFANKSSYSEGEVATFNCAIEIELTTRRMDKDFSGYNDNAVLCDGGNDGEKSKCTKPGNYASVGYWGSYQGNLGWQPYVSKMGIFEDANANENDGKYSNYCCNAGNRTFTAFTIKSSGRYRLCFWYCVAAQDAVNNNHREEKEVQIEFFFNLDIDKTPPALHKEFEVSNQTIFQNNKYYIKNDATTAPIAFVKNGSKYINETGEREEKSFFKLNSAERTGSSIPLSQFGEGFGKVACCDREGNASEELTFIRDTKNPNIENIADLESWFGTHGGLNEVGNSATRVVNLGMTNKNVGFEFAWSENEAPESAELSFRQMIYDEEEVSFSQATTQKYESKQVITKDGLYNLVMTDLVGNQTEIVFIIKKQAPLLNYKKITEQNFVSPSYHQVTLPTGYKNVVLGQAGKIGQNKYQGAFSNDKTYMFETYENALKFASDIETEYAVVKTQNGYVYKQISNSNATYEYINLQELKNAIEFYAKKMIKFVDTYKQTQNAELEKSKIVLDSSLLKNNSENATLKYNNLPASLIRKDFKFARKLIPGVSYYESDSLKITDLSTNEVVCDFQAGYNKNFADIAKGQGFYRVQESDAGGSNREYIVYFDCTPPVVQVKLSKFQDEGETILEVGESDTLSLYLNTLEIISISDSYGIDKFAMVEIKSSTNQNVSGVYYKDFPILSGNASGVGAGEYEITVYDRSQNKFSFKFFLYGKPPKVQYAFFGTGDAKTMTAKLSNGESYNAITDIKIFRNGEQLPNTYYEFENSEPIVISQTTLEYTFKLGGIYHFEITDNFGRTTKTLEQKFTKGLPEIVLQGATEGKKTRNNVTVSFLIDYMFVARFNANVISIQSTKDVTTGLQYLYIEASESSSGDYEVKVWNEQTQSLYNVVRFAIDKILPTVQIKTANGAAVENGDAVNENVIVSWDLASDIRYVSYTINGQFSQSYRKGTVLSKSGLYKLKVTDELGNVNYYEFLVDREVSFSIVANGSESEKLKKIGVSADGIDIFGMRSFAIIAKEELKITVIKDGYFIEYAACETINATGRYTIRLVDKYGSAVVLLIQIDNTPPVVALDGVQNGGKTSEKVTIIVEETEEIASRTVYKNNKLISFDGNIFSEHGEYRLVFSDTFGNDTSIIFTIDKIVDVDINVYDGAVTAEKVTIKQKENNLLIKLFKNDKEIEFVSSITEVAKYKIIATDEAANVFEISFEIIEKKAVKKFEIAIPETLVLESIKTKDGLDYVAKIQDGKIIIEEDGEFVITIIDEKTNKQYKITAHVIATPPTLQIKSDGAAVENGGVTTEKIVINKDANITYKVFLNEKEIQENTRTLSKNGSYKVVATDEAGNETVYTFTKKYKMNGAARAVIVVVVIVAIALLFAIAKTRFKFKVK